MTEGWQVLARQLLLDRAPWLSVWVERVRLGSGVIIDDYYRVDLLSWVAVFAVTDDGRVPLVRQYRHGIGAIMLELPAGYIDGDEETLVTTRRELREEVGGTADSFELVASLPVLAERSTMTMHVVLARGLRLTGAQQLEATEDITLHWLTLAELRAAVGTRPDIPATHLAAIVHGLAALDAGDGRR